MEGIYHNAAGIITVNGSLNNPQFVKCRLYMIKCGSSGTYGYMYYANFINCVIAYEVNFYSSGSATFVNCYVYDMEYYSSNSTASAEFQNCVVKDSNFSNVRNAVFRNCFLYATAGTSTSNKLPSSSPAYNCVALSATSSTNIFAYQSNTTNTMVSSLSDVFKTWTGSSLANFKKERLELTDAAKTKYLGSDGTQIGIYGGSIPFDPRPSNPQITKLNVASKSTADGKLSVDIEVKAAE